MSAPISHAPRPCPKRSASAPCRWRALAIALFAPLVIGCWSSDGPVLDVRLTTGPVTSIAEPPADESPVRFVLTSVLSPDRSTVPYARFAAHLTARLGRRVVMVRRRTYRELSDLLRNGHADAGIICAGVYAVGREEFGLRLLAVPVIGGSATYRAYVIARRDSGKRRLEDLRGSIFAFSDPLSNTGYRHVAALLHGRGTTPGQFFGRTFFTYSHDNTIEAVHDGIADAGVVDSLVWDHLLREDPHLAGEIEIIDRSAEFPNSPVVVSPRAAPDLVASLRRALIDMPADLAGNEILEDLGISGFVDLPDAAFDPIAQSWRELGVVTTPAGARR